MRPILLLLACFNLCAENWPNWRGPRHDGRSGETNLPVKWSPTENIAWKLPLPAWSGSTPVIWGDRIFLNVAESGNLELWCIDRNGPKVLWKKLLGAGDVKMRKQNMSSPTPVTDGKTVWTVTGTGIVKALDYAGKELWAREIQKDHGAFGLNWGYASSPLLAGDALYIEVLHGMKTDDPSYVLRLDAKTGKTVWRVERPTAAIAESPDAYTTPLLANGELVISGGDVLTGHDLATGKELWRAQGFNPRNNPMNRVVASPIFVDGIIYAPTRVRPLQAYRPGGRGDVTESHRVFQFNDGPDVPTPVSDGKYFYSINDRGIVYCLDAKTGQQIYGGERIKPGTYSASPILADGKLYITSEEGLTTVLAAGPKFEILAENSIPEYVLSSIAVSDGQLFLRTDKALYAIGSRKK